MFSFFTKRTTYASKRLRFVGRGMQIFGALMLGVSLLAAYLMGSEIVSVPQEMRDRAARSAITNGLLTMLSYVFIGRALLRRQKWGGYAALATIGIPALIRLIWMPTHNWLMTVTQIGAFTTITLILSVWNELGTVFESELVEHGTPPEAVEPFTPRNRGFGERQNIPAELAEGLASIADVAAVPQPVLASSSAAASQTLATPTNSNN